MILTHGSLCTGIGGFDIACEWLNIKTLWQIERDRFCLEVLEKNFPGVHREKEILNVQTKRLERPDIISAGIPCQPWSIAGVQKRQRDDRHLWPSVFAIIAGIRPTWVIIENVTGFVNPLGLGTAVFDLERQGYETQCFEIPACSINALHERQRVFLVAYSDGNRWKKGGAIEGQLLKAGKFREGLQLFERLACSQGNPWTNGPPFPPVADGVSRRLAKCRAVGNAVVPQVAIRLLAGIVAIETFKEEI